MLSLTRERAVSHVRELSPKTARPENTIGFVIAFSNIEGASEKLAILPTLVMPTFRRTCATEAIITLDNNNNRSFKTIPSVCLYYEISYLLFNVLNIGFQFPNTILKVL